MLSYDVTELAEMSEQTMQAHAHRLRAAGFDVGPVNARPHKLRERLSVRPRQCKQLSSSKTHSS